MKTWTPEEIKALRIKLNLFQKDMAEITGVTREYVNYLEKGVKVPSKTLKLLLDCIEEKHTGKRKRERRIKTWHAASISVVPNGG